MSRGFVRIKPIPTPLQTKLTRAVRTLARASERARAIASRIPTCVHASATGKRARYEAARASPVEGLARSHVYAECHLSSWLICHVLRYGDASDAVIIKMRISNNLRRI